jgi:hypothetical protein
LGYSGVKAYQAGDFAKASQELEKAYELLPAPSLGLWSARALVGLGRLVEANQRYLEVSRLPVSAGDPAVQQQAQADAAKELAQLTPRIPSVTLRFDGATAAEVEVSLDGFALPRAELGARRLVNPGRHQVEARRGTQLVESAFEIAEGAAREVVLNFDLAAPGSGAAITPSGMETSQAGASARTDPRRTLVWVALGVGGAGLAFGTFTGLLALGKKSDLDDSPHCHADKCLDPERESVNTYNSLRTLSSVGFATGIGFGAAGAILLLLRPKEREPASTALRKPSASIHFDVAPGGASIRGAF